MHQADSGEEGEAGGRTARPDPAALIELANARMPFGKYKGQYLVDLPEPYVVWFVQKGVPPGKLGVLLRSLYEIKVNGLEDLLRPLRGRASRLGH